nr:uncharacterized protein LOC107452968 [Parasteatoda tepidariorum]
MHGRNLARKIAHDCVICTKFKPRFLVQKMGDLPSVRCKPTFPFLNSGTDFAGPFFIKNKNQRKGPFQKIFIAIFVCLVTKAIHIEIVSNLTSGSFIATLKRFIACKGKCSILYSDNAKTYLGANRELKRLYNLVSKPDETLSKFLISERINWKFIPPRSPNFGGIWESGIKSFKFHLKRTIGTLTYEEFLTIINQIEGILNSRPLMPLSSDADDLDVLTPAHF